MQLKMSPPPEILSPLLAYSGNITSQFGEDGIIAHIIKTITPAHAYCVEFGAWDGKHLSNCYSLLAQQGWAGTVIEANTTRFQDLVKTFADFPKVLPLNRLVDFEGANSLDNILREAGAPQSFGLLSIDIDGNDYHIWEALTAYTPEIIVIEFNPTIPNDVFFVQDRSFDVSQGCSLLALILLGKKKGYELAACTIVNAIFVKADKFPLLGVTNNSIYRLYTPTQNGRIFQGYDGTIHVVGFNRIMWRSPKVYVSSEDFQIFPKEQRVYHDAISSVSLDDPDP